MIIKEPFELIVGKSGKVNNVVPVKSTAVNTYKIKHEEDIYLRSLVKMVAQTKKQIGSDVVLKNINVCNIVSVPTYPLPGFVSKDMKSYANISYLPVNNVSDISPQDAFSIYLYSLALGSFIKNKPISDSAKDDVSNFIYAIFIKIYGKKSGLMGSYAHMMPKLKFIVTLYVYCAMFGLEDSDRLRTKIASDLYTRFDDLKLDYDFSSTAEFLKCIQQNQIISLSLNKFSTDIVNIGGASSVPMFEDLSRFYATILCSSVSGSTVFTSFWSKIPGNLYQKLVYSALSKLS